MAADLYGLEASGLPPELIAQLQGLTRKQAIAQAMLRQSMESPQPGDVKGRFQGVVSPMEYIAKALQGVQARGQLSDVDKGMAGVAGEKQRLVAKAISDFQNQSRGTPGIESDRQPGLEGPMPAIPGSMRAPDPRGAIEAGYANPLMNRDILKAGQSALDKGETREDQQAFLKEQSQQAQAARAHEAEQNRLARKADVEARIAATKEGSAERNALMIQLRQMGIDSANSIADKRIEASRTGADEKVNAKLRTTMPKVKLQVESFENNVKNLTNTMQELHDDKGLNQITGLVGGRVTPLSDDARRAKAKLDTINARMFRDNLAAMRAASPTGGAVGNVSDREGDKLEKMLVALDRTMGTKDFQAALVDAQRQLRESAAIIRKAYEEEYGSLSDGAPAGASAPGGGGKVIRFDAQGNQIP